MTAGAGDDLDRVLAALVDGGLPRAEVYAKEGRSRHFALGAGGEVVTSSSEAGWAVRAGDEGASFFLSGSGEPRRDFPWPEGAAGGLSLPEPVAESAKPPAWDEAEGLDAPLAGERQGRELLSALASALAAELPGARLLSATLDDGASASRLASSLGVQAAWRSRVAALAVEAAGPEGVTASLEAAARHARAFDPGALARRLADRLTVAAGGPPEEGAGSLLLAPWVAARLLAGLTPLWTGAVPPAAFADRAGRLGSELLTVVDDGRHPAGVLAAPVDGEGMPTRRVVLVEEGRFRQPLAPWSAPPESGEPSGCMRRFSFRDLPLPGPTHLFIPPSPRLSVSSLLAGLERGHYLIDAPGPAAFDFAQDRFHLPVRGFAVGAGRPRRAVAGAVLTGAVTTLLRGLEATARDLELFPLDGMIGSPTLRLGGVTLEAGSER